MLKITEKKLIALKLLEVGRLIEEVQANPERYTLAYLDKLEAQRIGLITEYFRKFHENKVVHIDTKRFKTGRI